MNEPSAGRVVRLRLRPEKAQEIIREIASDTKNVILSDHAKVRMEGREISGIEICRVLQTGMFSRNRAARSTKNGNAR